MYKKLAIFLLMLSGCGFSAFAQNSKSKSGGVKLLPLIEHNNKYGGCFVEDSKGAVYCQLTPLDSFYLNLTGTEEVFQEVSDQKRIPKGYKYGYQKKDTLVFLKETLIRKQGAMEINRYDIIIRIGKKEYKQKLDGFCAP